MRNILEYNYKHVGLGVFIAGLFYEIYGIHMFIVATLAPPSLPGVLLPP